MDERSDYPDAVLKVKFEVIRDEQIRLLKTINGLPGEVAEIKSTQKAQGRQLEAIDQTITGGKWSKATVVPLVIGVSSVLLMFATIVLSLVSLF